jgi:HEPN domain-containing protein
VADTSVPDAWFKQADLDFQAAELLLNQEGPPTIVAFHVQQTIEKYLKGYLLSVGEPLRRIHDLEVLLGEAIAHDASFAPFLSDCQRITEYYIEARYPVGVTTLFQPAMLETDLRIARDLIALIRDKTTHPGAEA